MNNKKIAVILAVRYNSTRLPKKCLLPLAGEATIIELIVKRLKKSNTIDDIIIATTDESYTYLKEIIEKLNCNFYIGDEENVLSRYVEAAEKYDVDIIVRATGDNPLVSVKALDLIVEHHKRTNADLSHYDKLPYGSGVEVINYDALKYASDNSKDMFEKEHITQYIYRNSDKFNIEFPLTPDSFNNEKLHTTVDTKEDYENVKKIFEKYNNDIYLEIDTIIKDLR